MFMIFTMESLNPYIMKTYIYILLFFIPLTVCAQQNSWYKDSPLGYMWMNVGNADFSTLTFYNTLSFAFNSSGEPFVSYIDMTNLWKPIVMKFDGTDWINVGNPDFSTARVSCLDLAINPADDQPYVSFMDEAYSYKASVMRFDGTNWVYVGNPGFT